MDVTDITPLLEQLDNNLETLEDSFEPLLKDVHASLRLQGIDAKQHSVFTELTRIRQYFQKIKELEEPPAERTQTVDKQAAIRFLKTDLAGSKDINTKLKELLAKERAKAALKSKVQKRPAEDSIAEEQDAGDQAEEVSTEEGEIEEGPPPKKSKRSKNWGKKKNKRHPTVKGPHSQ